MNGACDAQGLVEPAPLDWTAPFPELLRTALPPARSAYKKCPDRRYGIVNINVKTKVMNSWKPPCRKYRCSCMHDSIDFWRKQMNERIFDLAPYRPAKDCLPGERQAFLDKFWVDDEPRVFWTRYEKTTDVEDRRIRKRLAMRMAKVGAPGLRCELYDGSVHVLSTADVTNRTTPRDGRWLCGADAYWLVRRLISRDATLRRKPKGTRGEGRDWHLEDPQWDGDPDMEEIGEKPYEDEESYFYARLDEALGVRVRAEERLPQGAPIDAVRLAWAAIFDELKAWRSLTPSARTA